MTQKNEDLASDCVQRDPLAIGIYVTDKRYKYSYTNHNFNTTTWGSSTLTTAVSPLYLS